MKYLHSLRRFLTPQEVMYWVGLIFLSIAGIIVLRYLTPQGLGLVNDSVGYIAGARNILAGNGYARTTGDWRTVPITNYPPMFSIAIALVSLFGLEAIRASRLVVLACFAWNIILFAVLIRKLTKSRLLSIIACILFFSLEPILRIHTFALSEPLYLLFTLSFLLSSIYYIETSKWCYVVFNGLVVSAAFLTRYVGITLFGVAIVFIILMPARSLRKRISDTVLFLVSGTPGIAWWLIRNYVLSGNAVNRKLIYHTIPSENFTFGLDTFWDWLMPNWINMFNEASTNISLILFISTLVMVIAFTLFYLLRSMKKDNKTDLTQGLSWTMIGVHGIGYLVVLFCSLMFVDSSPIFENRIIMPYILSLFICVVLLISYRINDSVYRSIFCRATLIVCIAINIPDSVIAAKELHESGQGYIAYHWTVSQVISEIKKIDNKTIYSNKPNAIYILANKASYTLTSPYNPATQQYREGYDENIKEIREKVINGDAVIVIFDYQSYIDDKDDPEKQWIVELTNELPVLSSCYDGYIFGFGDD